MRLGNKRPFLAPALSLALLAGCGPTWQDVSSQNGRYRVRLPGAPTPRGGRLDNPRGGPIAWVGQAVDLGHALYFVNYSELPRQAPWGLAQALARMADHWQGEIVHQQPVKLNGYDGLEFEVNVRHPRPGVAVGRLYQVSDRRQNRFFQVVAAGTAVSRSDPKVIEFLDSFELTDARDPTLPPQPAVVAAVDPPRPDPAFPAPDQGQPRPQPEPFVRPAFPVNPVPPGPGAERDVNGLKVREAPVDAADSVPALCWDADATGFYLVHGPGGAIKHVKLDDFSVLQSGSVGRKIDGLCRSAGGLVLTAVTTQELLVVDPESLALTKTVQVPGVTRVTSAPGLALAVAQCGDDRSPLPLVVVDLKAGQVVGQLPRQAPVPGRFRTETRTVGNRPQFAPDGKHLFTTGSRFLYRYKVEEEKITADQDSFAIGPHFRDGEVCVSPDGKLVCLTGGNENNVPGHPAVSGKVTYVYRSDNLRQPVTALEGADQAPVAFDPPAKLIYTRPWGLRDLLVYHYTGGKAGEYDIDRGANARALLPHPDGGKLLLLTDRKLFLVTVPPSLWAAGQTTRPAE